MPDSQQPVNTTIRLDESVVRLAERIASRYGITVQQLIETLLLDWREPESPPHVPPVAKPKRRARVIDITEARRHRTDRSA
jgi:hypothetical protein